MYIFIGFFIMFVGAFAVWMGIQQEISDIQPSEGYHYMAVKKGSTIEIMTLKDSTFTNEKGELIHPKVFVYTDKKEE